MRATVREPVLTRVRTGAARALLAAGVTPNMMTVCGAVGSVAGAVGFAARGQLLAAVLVITLSALCDALDGMMARASGRVSRFGALLDSTLDRISDGAIFAALAFWLGSNGQHRVAALALGCLLSAYLVSYVRARAEGLGLSCEVGIAHRYHRLLLLGLSCLLASAGLRWALEAGLWILLLATVVTAAQRLQSAHRQLNAG